MRKKTVTSSQSSVQPATQTLTFFGKVKKFLKSTWNLFISQPNPKESIVQWIIRQFILADSRGNPSWTITLAVIIIIYLGYSVKTELTVAMSTVKTYDPATGSLISESMKGISDSFWYMMIVAYGAVSYLFQKRFSRGVEDNHSSVINTLIDTASTAIGKIKDK